MTFAGLLLCMLVISAAVAQQYSLQGHIYNRSEEPLQGARIISSIQTGEFELSDTTYTDGHGLWKATWNLTASEPTGDNPSGYHLANNYPNPFNPRTNLVFETPDGGDYLVGVYDVLGRSVMSENVSLGVGEHSIDLSFGGLAAGTYIINIFGDGGRWTETATLAGRSSGNRGITVNRGNHSSNNVSNKQSLEQAIQNNEALFNIRVDDVEGYSPWDTTFTSENREHFFNIELEKESEPTQTYTFQGTVTNPDRPLEGAMVITRFGEQPRDTLYTNQNGQWIQNREKTLQQIIDAGEYNIIFKEPDHITKDTTITLHPEQTNYTINTELEKAEEPTQTYTFQGTLTNPDRPLEGAMVITKFGEQPRDTLFTNQNGQWQNTYEKTLQQIIDSGEYTITAKKQDHVTKDTTIILNPEQTNYVVNMTLEREQQEVENSLSVVLRNSYDSTPLENANVILSWNGNEVSSFTNNEGVANINYTTFEGEEPDKINVRTSLDDYTDKEIEVAYAQQISKELGKDRIPEVTEFSFNSYNIHGQDTEGMEFYFQPERDSVFSAMQDENGLVTVTFEDRKHNLSDRVKMWHNHGGTDGEGDPNFTDVLILRPKDIEWYERDMVRNNDWTKYWGRGEDGDKHFTETPHDTLDVYVNEVNNKDFNSYVMPFKVEHPTQGIFYMNSKDITNLMFSRGGGYVFNWTDMHHNGEHVDFVDFIIHKRNRSTGNLTSEENLQQMKEISNNILSAYTLDNGEVLGNFKVSLVDTEQDSVYQAIIDRDYENFVSTQRDNISNPINGVSVRTEDEHGNYRIWNAISRYNEGVGNSAIVEEIYESLTHTSNLFTPLTTRGYVWDRDKGINELGKIILRYKQMVNGETELKDNN